MQRGYLSAAETAFGSEMDYAVLEKISGPSPEVEKRYSPAACIGCNRHVIVGQPDPEHISASYSERHSPPRITGMVSTVISGKLDPLHIGTSYVERQNLTIRMCMRRLTRLTNAFSKMLENLKAAVALHFAYYNLVQVHQSLHVTSAMEEGLSDGNWTLTDFMEEVR